MRQVLMLAGLGLLLAGCGEELTPEEQAQANERDVAMVERANRAAPPVVPVTPEPILLPDIQRYDLLGESCSYAPGTSLGARVISREADAFMKIEGDIERFAADPGSRELPMRTRSVYNSANYSLVLAIRNAGEGGAPEGSDSADGEDLVPSSGGNFEGTVTLHDAYGRVVYEGVGPAQCAS